MCPKRNVVAVVILGAVAAMGMSSSVMAGAIATNVMYGNLDLGSLSLTAPAVYNDGTSGGVTISGQFVGNYPPLKNGVVPMWVQLISTNSPLNTNAGANNPYFDPGELDLTGDTAPFYWNITPAGKDGNNYPQYYYKNKLVANNAGSTTFVDQPKRGPGRRPSTGPRSWTWFAGIRPARASVSCGRGITVFRSAA